MSKTAITSYSLLLFLLVTISIVVAQVRPLGNKFKHVPVYRSEKDSTEHKKIEALIMYAYNTKPQNQNRIDSLVALWSTVSKSGKISYRKNYTPSPGFSPYDSLSFKKDKSQVTKISISSKKLRKIPEDILHCSNLMELKIVNTRFPKIQSQLNDLKNLKKITILNN